MKTRRQVQPDQAVSQLLPQGRLHEPVLEASWLQAAQRLNIDGSGIWELLCVTSGSGSAAEAECLLSLSISIAKMEACVKE